MSDPFNADTTTVDTSKDYLAELVGEGKKYKTEQDLAKGNVYANAHIQTLERTLAEMREELKTRKTQEDLLDKISSMRTGGEGTTVEPTRQEDQTQKGLTAEDVSRMFAEREAAQRQNQNLTSTIQTLTERFGDQTAFQISQKAEELGVTKDELRDMAKTKPGIFLALFPAQQAPVKDVFGAPAGSVRNTAAVPANTGDKWSDHQKVKRDNPTLYFSPAYQRKLVEAGERAMLQGRYEQWKNS